MAPIRVPDHGLYNCRARHAVRPDTRRRDVRFPDAALSFAVDDHHHDCARIGRGELGDHRHTQPAHSERDGYDEAVELIGKVFVRGR